MVKGFKSDDINDTFKDRSEEIFFGKEGINSNNNIELTISLSNV